mmetsp:Transcript_72219/g.157470  ORF Transcript_72219/g.157470 Transcript_72219/m.157470 type:complete len:205 (+) Transcript_72219:569-1183(+)
MEESGKAQAAGIAIPIALAILLCRFGLRGLHGLGLGLHGFGLLLQDFAQVLRRLRELLRTHDAEDHQDTSHLHEVDAVAEDHQGDEHREQLPCGHDPSKGQGAQNSDGGVDAKLAQGVDDAEAGDAAGDSWIRHRNSHGGLDLAPRSYCRREGDEETQQVAAQHHLGLGQLGMLLVEDRLPLGSEAVADEEEAQHEHTHPHLVG